MVVIVDYGVGNLGSIKNMLKRAGCASQISSNPNEIQQASKLILPGIGAFDECAANLRATGLIPLLNQRVLEERVPVLGICLGMQLLTRRSEEGEQKEHGLSWIEADTKRINNQDYPTLRIPHMGWNFVDFHQSSPLAKEMPEDARFYFVHSYQVVCDHEADILMTTEYGYPFTVAVQHNNIYGVQFHPEKSHKYGLQLLKNFVEAT